ncbi:MAG: hypothetical protein ACFB50_02660 [Rubrobacteraceae bacterium]
MGSFRTFLLAGFLAGAVAAVLANVVYGTFRLMGGTSYEELSATTISLASVIPGLLGAVFYYGLTRWVGRPATVLVAVALVAATADSVIVAVNEPQPGFALIATPLHYVVALSIALVLPAVASRLAEKK